MIAIGIGCRKDCASADIVALVRQALTNAARKAEEATLFTIVDKQGEPGLAEAAQNLGVSLVFLDRAALQQVAPRAHTYSPRVMEAFGVPSVAETSALAGAGEASVLLVTRMSQGGASCAIAERGLS
jgi:cobalt-precorrin 5A hydrolase